MGSYVPPRGVAPAQPPVLSIPQKKSSVMADVGSVESAKKAAKSGMWAAFVVAAITTIFAIIAMANGKELAGIDGTALVDAAIFAAIGIGIARYSRVAAVAGLVIYVGERIYMMSVNGPQGILLSIIITLAFINSVRGTFAYHRLTETL